MRAHVLEPTISLGTGSGNTAAILVESEPFEEHDAYRLDVFWAPRTVSPCRDTADP